jgi:hypothetical protein
MDSSPGALRAKAVAIREQANGVGDAWVRRELYELADLYEALASQSESLRRSARRSAADRLSSIHKKPLARVGQDA